MTFRGAAEMQISCGHASFARFVVFSDCSTDTVKVEFIILYVQIFEIYSYHML